jgi:hypothetical protein
MAGRQLTVNGRYVQGSCWKHCPGIHLEVVRKVRETSVAMVCSPKEIRIVYIRVQEPTCSAICMDGLRETTNTFSHETASLWSYFILNVLYRRKISIELSGNVHVWGLTLREQATIRICCLKFCFLFTFSRNVSSLKSIIYLHEMYFIQCLRRVSFFSVFVDFYVNIKLRLVF